MSKALTAFEVMERFSIKSPTTVYQLLKEKGSPAYNIGVGRGNWRVDEDDFKAFLQQRSEKSKS